MGTLETLAWLSAAPAAWIRELENGDAKARVLVKHKLQHWQQDADLAGVRSPEALAKLPRPSATVGSGCGPM